MTNASVSNATSGPACSARISVGAGLVMPFENTLANQSNISLHLAYSANQGLDEDNDTHTIFRLER